MLRDAAKDEKYATALDIIRQIALTSCRRSEMIRLKWTETDTEASCLRLEDSKEGESIRPIGLPVVEYLERRHRILLPTRQLLRQTSTCSGLPIGITALLFSETPVSLQTSVLRPFDTVFEIRSFRVTYELHRKEVLPLLSDRRERRISIIGFQFPISRF